MNKRNPHNLLKRLNNTLIFWCDDKTEPNNYTFLFGKDYKITLRPYNIID